MGRYRDPPYDAIHHTPHGENGQQQKGWKELYGRPAVDGGDSGLGPVLHSAAHAHLTDACWPKTRCFRRPPECRADPASG